MPALAWRLGELDKWERIDRWSMSQLIEPVAVSLFAKEHRPSSRLSCGKPSGAIAPLQAIRPIETRRSHCPEVSVARGPIRELRRKRGRKELSA